MLRVCRVSPGYVVACTWSSYVPATSPTQRWMVGGSHREEEGRYSQTFPTRLGAWCIERYTPTCIVFFCKAGPNGCDLSQQVHWGGLFPILLWAALCNRCSTTHVPLLGSLVATLKSLHPIGDYKKILDKGQRMHLIHPFLHYRKPMLAM